MPEGLPEPISLRLDPGTRRSDGGRTLIGGSPLRVLRLTDAGARIVDDLESGATVDAHPSRQRVARALLDAGMAHPVPGETPPLTVGIVIPVRDDAVPLASLLDAVDGAASVDEVIVVDDGSVDPSSVERVIAGRARLLRSDTSQGPAAARNRGWRASSADLVAFVDADVTPPQRWIEGLVPHFSDPRVAAVAPRVRGRPNGNSTIDRYERHRSPLDLGPDEARVTPGGRVSYVPTATVLFRRDVLEANDGFDESLRFGEDVDLVWRVARDHTIRYEPAVEVVHDNRSTWAGLVRQRMQYGSSAAHLDRRHPGQVAPVAVNAWSLAAWALVAWGGPTGTLAGLSTAAVSGGLLWPTLRDRVDDPLAETIRLAGRGNLWAGRWLATATTRAWMPLAVVASMPSRRARRALAAAVIVPSLLEWNERHPSIDPVTWTAARLVDDAAYCAGVWRGCRDVGRWRAIRPRLSGIPGLTDR